MKAQSTKNSGNSYRELLLSLCETKKICIFAGSKLTETSTGKMKTSNAEVLLEIRKAAIQKYDSYGDEWEKAYFDEYNGGYLVVNKQRIEQGNINKQEKEKYNKEYSMCLTLARNGYKVEYLKMTDGSFDIYLNDISADLKKTVSHNNILNYAQKATRKQGAEIVVFEFDTITGKIWDELNKIKRMSIKVKYFISENKVIIDL